MKIAKKFLLFLFLLSLVSAIFASTKIDSLQMQLPKLKGVKKARILIEIAQKYYEQKEYKTSIDFLNKASDYLKIKKTSKDIYDYYSILGKNQLRLKEHTKSIKNFSLALETARTLNLQDSEAHSLANLALDHWYLGEYYNALSYFTKAEEIFEKIEDNKMLSFCYNNIGSIYAKQGNYQKAVDIYLKSLQLKEEMNEEYRISKTLNNLGNCYIRLRKFEKALDYYQRAYKIKADLGSEESTSLILNNIGNVYLELQDYDLAEEHYNKALVLNRKTGDYKKIACSLNNIGIVLEKRGDIKGAIKSYQDALELKKQVKDKYGVANCLKNIGDANLQLNSYNKAYQNLSASLKLAKDIDAKTIIRDVYLMLSRYYEKIGDLSSALDFERKHKKLDRKLINEETQIKIKDLESVYKLGKVSEENQALAKDNEIYRLKLAKENIFKIILLMIIVIIVLLTFILLYIHYTKIQKNKILKNANDKLEIRVCERTSKLEQLNKELNKEISYGKKVETKLRKSLNEKEVLLKELHHRVRNNLQVISSIIDLQSEEITEEKYIQIFKNAQNRISSMLLVHEKLYVSKDFSEVDFKEYVELLVSNLMGGYSIAKNKIKSIIDIADIPVNINHALAFGMIINELVTNSLKYAFPDQRSGEIMILYKKNKNSLILTVGNNGVDFPKNIKIEEVETVGLQVVFLLAQQIKAEVVVEKKDGVKFTFTLKSN